MKKVLFLDVDGVLNGYGPDTAHQRMDVEHDVDPWCFMIYRPQVERLNRILDATGAQIVLSSSWKWHRTPEQMTTILAARGCRHRVIDKTPDLVTSREAEIRLWLLDHYVSTYLVLDDCRLTTGFEGLVSHRLLQTDGSVGLTDADVELAIALLGHYTAQRR